MGAGLIAPSGQVLVSNPEFRRLLPPSTIPSMNGNMGKDWIALHPDGQRMEPQDYPGARALRGEVTLNIDFRHWSGSRGERWLRVSGIPVHDDDGSIAAALLVLMDVGEEKRPAERQLLLTRELDHRAKNILAVVQAALRLTRADDMPTFIRAIEGRVTALARAQAVLAADRWSSADLHALLRGGLVTFLDEGGSGPWVDLRGPVVALPPGAAQPLAIAVHELATNALKYGALSVPAGAQLSAGGSRPTGRRPKRSPACWSWPPRRCCFSRSPRLGNPAFPPRQRTTIVGGPLPKTHRAADVAINALVLGR
jgi:two-component sensor histidine kinase